MPQAITDAEHLRMLSIGHYVMAGLSLVFGSFPLIHVFVGSVVVAGSAGARDREAQIFGWFFIVAGAVFIALAWTYGVLMFLAARWLAERRKRKFCFVMGCISCAHAPLGTVLGIFTILVLGRPSVQALFDRQLPGAGIGTYSLNR